MSPVINTPVTVPPTFDVKQPCSYATAAALAAVTYSNGPNNDGVGATLTANANGILTVDGIAAVAGQRILVKNQASALQNGIYTVTAIGVVAVSPFILTRAVDANQSADWESGVLVAVAGPLGSLGVANDDTLWLSTAAKPFTIGTTGIAFSRVGAATLLWQ